MHQLHAASGKGPHTSYLHNALLCVRTEGVRPRPLMQWTTKLVMLAVLPFPLGCAAPLPPVPAAPHADRGAGDGPAAPAGPDDAQARPRRRGRPGPAV